jgi:tRNA threonylcarbamoyladenosine dehydratase
MDSYLNFHSHKTQLVLTALAASLTTAGLLSAYSSYNRRARRRNLSHDVLRSIGAHDSDAAAAGNFLPALERKKDILSQSDGIISINGGSSYNDELVREQLARNYAFFGEEGMARVRAGSVVVVGCGGVGSWAAVMLVRSCVNNFAVARTFHADTSFCRGVSKIRLVDFDYVTLSSLNRHATAGIQDVGMPKVTCIERTLRQISRCVEVDSRIEIWRKGDGDHLLAGVDWVVGKTQRYSFLRRDDNASIDAIDNITTKVDLLKYCFDNKIKVAIIGARLPAKRLPRLYYRRSSRRWVQVQNVIQREYK